MQAKAIHQTLAILLASVFFYTANLAANNTQIDVAWQLARDLYTEGDWQHAQIEAARVKHTNSEHAKAGEAILHLTALQLQIKDEEAYNQLQQWLKKNADHPKHDWINDEVKALEARHDSINRSGITAFFARMFIGFYQTQIGPALGQRCSMYPSCSHYTLEACREYGLAGIPMSADRLIRETDHVRYRIDPIRRNGRELYYDPIENHTYWFRRYQK